MMAHTNPLVTPEAEACFLDWCTAANVQLYPWQVEAYGQALRRIDNHFVHRLAGISVPRGDGKSYGDAATGLWRLTAGPPGQDILSGALDYEGSKVVLDHARRIIAGSDELAALVEVRADSILCPATGSRWTVTSREHTSSRGRHPTLILYDEVGWARDDELFSSLLAGQASVEDPLMLVTSTVGRRKTGPLWTVKTLAEGGDPSVFWYWHGTNRSPRVTQAFLDRQRRILVPAQFAREHQNLWVDSADSFTTAEEVDAALATGWREELAARRDVRAVLFVDLGTVRDPSVIALGYEEDGRARIARLITFQGSHEAPVQLSAVEAAIRQLCNDWRVSRVRVESWQGVASVQSLSRLGLPIELFAPTAKAHSEEWPTLAARLSSRTIDLFPHARLREELLNLAVEIGPTGVKVTDRGKVHQDHAVAVRGVVAMLGTEAGMTGHTNYSATTGEPMGIATISTRPQLDCEFRAGAPWNGETWEGGGRFIQRWIAGRAVGPDGATVWCTVKRGGSPRPMVIMRRDMIEGDVEVIA